MRSSKSRSRNKSNRQRSLGNVVNRVFDSSGPEGKVRGTPQQIIEKYLTLARDAQLSGDRVAEQAFLQHAEHYTRMLGEAQREMAERQQFHQPRPDGEEAREGQGNGYSGQQPGRDQATRDQAPREEQGRENGHRDRDRAHRDQNGREQAAREHAPRDGQREHAGREQGGREQGGRDHGMRAEPAAAPVSPPAEAIAPAPVDETEIPQGLPDVLTTVDDEAAGPVETPEAAAKPVRTRAPRAPRGDKPATPRTGTGRGRRKPVEDAAKPEDTPAASGE